MADNYFLYPAGGSSGPELSAFGAPVVLGEFGAFNPIAAEATASGYEVAWKATGADQYTVLNADSSGTFLSHAFFVVSGNSYALQSLEASFQQDVNGDGRIGPLTTVIESAGSTSLAQVADAYFLYQGGGSSGPQLRLSGAYVAAGQFGAWTPIGAEQVGSVYEVAWKNGAADQYLEWTVDGSGNYITQGSVVSGSTWWVQSFEVRPPPGPQQRRDDRSYHDDDRGVWIGHPGPGRGRLLREPGLVGSPVAVWRHLCGGG